ncbi:MAG: hypothetical protein DLM72_05765 [Candidatus Nitrosopolaris wilkensis]|nr:MAG: hypothetical protein DLM72_05765 [Candidatus Nitrosopolaris wilkensis]
MVKKTPTAEKYAKEFESFKGTPFGQKVNYGADFDENIQVVENYNNIRNLHIDISSEDEAKYLKTLPDDSRLKPGPAQEQMHPQEVGSSQGNETKNNLLEAERIDVTEFASKQPINFASPKTIEGPIESLKGDSKSTEPEGRGIKSAYSAGSSPIRLPSLHDMTSERLKKVTEEDKRRAPIIDRASLSLVRITSEGHMSMPSMGTTPSAIVHPSVASSASSPPSPILTMDEHKEAIPNLSKVEIGSTKIEVKADDNTLPSVSKGSTTMMVAASTSIISDKEIDVKPVLAEPIPMLAKAKEEEQQIIPMSEESIESNIPGLDTLTLTSKSAEETESTNSGEVNQLTPLAEGPTETIENINSMLDYYFNPFLAGMTMWQGWLDMFN